MTRHLQDQLSLKSWFPYHSLIKRIRGIWKIANSGTRRGNRRDGTRLSYINLRLCSTKSKEALKGKEFALTEVCQRDINCDKLT